VLAIVEPAYLGTDNPKAQAVRSSGYQIAGRATRPHRHPALSDKAFWIDSARR